MNPTVRVRFAPSPTGPLHIGGLRTALFNYLFAKKNKGSFILRIEDTDQNRFVPGAEDYIIKALEWCGIAADEMPGIEGPFGPYRQSERKDLYQTYVDKLIQKGAAYYAFDTAEALDAHRSAHESKGKTFIYNWHNREKLDNSLNLSSEVVSQRIGNGEPYVVRFKSPENRNILLNDIIRGTITIDSNILDDKVLFKSDGMPTYHLANIVDDHLMQITHVIRGEEWLPSLALHHLLYEAFDWEAPEFAHLPLIMKPVGKGKLSKRDGDKMGFPVFPLNWKESQGYKEAGYFPEAVVNFLALLGWNPGTEQEIFSLEELVDSFTLERVNKAGARFDPEKNKWYNHKYLQQKTNAELAHIWLPELSTKDIPAELLDTNRLVRIIGLIKERANFVADFWSLGDYFFKTPESYNPKAVKKQWKEATPGILEQVYSLLDSVADFSSNSLETELKSWIGEQQLSFGAVMPPLRLVLVGDLKGPHIFDIMELLGKSESLARIRKAIDTISV